MISNIIEASSTISIMMELQSHEFYRHGTLFIMTSMNSIIMSSNDRIMIEFLWAIELSFDLGSKEEEFE